MISLAKTPDLPAHHTRHVQKAKVISRMQESLLHPEMHLLRSCRSHSLLPSFLLQPTLLQPHKMYNRPCRHLASLHMPSDDSGPPADFARKRRNGRWLHWLSETRTIASADFEAMKKIVEDAVFDILKYEVLMDEQEGKIVCAWIMAMKPERRMYNLREAATTA